MQNKYLPGIDGLRTIAVLSVVLFHLGFSSFSGGYVGVDIFYVISGYLITRLIAAEIERTQTFSFSNFYLRRARRLLPALYFVLVCSFIAAFVLFTPQHFQRFGGELLYSATSLSNFFFWSESGYFNTASEFKPLLHTWSLSVEEQFYLAWPVVLVFLLKKSTRSVVVALLITTSCLSLFANFVMADGHSDFLSKHSPLVAEWFKDGAASIFFLTPFRVFEFAIGAALIFLDKRRSESVLLQEGLMATGLLMIGYAIFSYTEKTVFPSYNALIPCIGAALVIYSVNAKYLGSIVTNRIAVFIGLISYSVYLVHWPLFVFYKYYRMTPIGIAEKIGLLLATVVFGYLIYRYIETPLRHPNRSENQLSKAGFGFACASLVIVLAIPAATVWASSGWAWRSPEVSKDIAAQIKDSKQFHVDQFGGAGFDEPYGWISGGETGIADIVVIGDSHAEQLKTGLREIIGVPDKKNIYFATSSCLILPGLSRNTPGADYDSICPQVLSNGLSVIQHSPNAVLIIAESWDFQIQNAVRFKDRQPLFAGDLKAAYANLAPSLAELKSIIEGHPLIIVGGVPGAGSKDAIGCLLRPKFITYDCDKILITQESIKSALTGNAMLKQFSETHSGTQFINPFEAFCFNGLCRSLEGGKVLYSDGSHLSKDGSRVFVRYFHDRILNVMETSQLTAKLSNL